MIDCLVDKLKTIFSHSFHQEFIWAEETISPLQWQTQQTKFARLTKQQRPYPLIKHTIIHIFLHLTVRLKISERPLFISCRCSGLACFCLSSNCSSLSGTRKDVLRFLRIQMDNCTWRPALNDEWPKKAHFILCPAYLSAALWYSSWKCAK